jgi:hypothetical protein
VSRQCVISGFRCEVHEVCAVLHYHIGSSVNFLPTFRGKLSVPSSKAKKSTECSSSESEEQYKPLKMGSIGCPESSVRNYHYFLRNNPVEGVSQCHDHLMQQTAVQLNQHNTVTHLEEVAIYTSPCHCNNTDKP